jgi:hypothetical protein
MMLRIDNVLLPCYTFAAIAVQRFAVLVLSCQGQANLGMNPAKDDLDQERHHLNHFYQLPLHHAGKNHIPLI